MLGRRRSLIFTYFVLGFSVLIIITIARSRFAHNVLYYNQYTERRYVRLLLKEQVGDDDTFIPKSSSSQFDHEPFYTRLFNRTRSNIEKQLSDYNVSLYGKQYGIKDLVMESGGQPLRTLIVSTWKSGTTFLAEILNAIPGTYYHYEPLLMYEIRQIRGPPEAKTAVKTIKAMLKCNYKNLTDYFEFGRMHKSQFKYNTRLWRHCHYNIHLCYSSQLTSQFCKIFPFQIMKIVRLRLHLVLDILRDKDLNVKIILLIRDPRGVMQSRRHCTFCNNKPDCNEPSRLCHDMLSDYTAASLFLRKYPERLMVLRFEELALRPYNITSKILKFLGHSTMQPIHEYLEHHTNYSDVRESTLTFRISSKVPFKWKYTLDFKTVNEIQMACKLAMDKWGYKMALNATHMISEDFNPLQDYTI